MENENIKEYPEGITQTKRGFSLVWIVPIVAVLITVGMIYESYLKKGTRIYITIENGAGIIAGKTPLMYKGIQIGSVEKVGMKEDDVSKLQITVVVDKASSESVTRKGNKFWMVKPKISITEITGLDTLIKGAYIAVMPATTTKKALVALPYEKSFIALNTPPIDIFKPGLVLTIKTINKGDISIGAPVLYNKQAIGEIEDKQLSKDRLSINLSVRIENKYIDLIHDKSLFYKADAIEVKAGLTNVKVNMGSFASFIAGGVCVFNPKEAFISPLSKDHDVFPLYDSFDEIMLDSDEIVLSMKDRYTFSPDITKLFYKGVEAGLVKGLKYDRNTNETKIQIQIHKNFRAYANTKAYFWVVRPRLDFDKIEGLDAIVRGNYINFTSKDLNAEKKSKFILHDKKPKKDGLTIRLIAQDIQSLKEGAGVFYHNIEIGIIDSYTLNKDKISFTVSIIIEPKYAKLLNASSSFYHNSGISFEASLSKVAIRTGSLETILRGGIAVETSSFKVSKKLKKSYTLHQDYETLIREKYLAENGIYLTLIAKGSGSLKKGSPLLYKQIKVGKVLSSKWDTKTQQLYLKAFIFEEYASEVHSNTLFYNASGLRVKIGLNGLEIDTESIETIISGGISFFTPSTTNLKALTKDNMFTLYETKDEAINTYFNISILAEDSYGLKVGSPLKYKNVSIGQIESIQLKDKNVLIDIQMDSKYKSFVKKDTIFWLEGFELSLSGVKNPSAALTGPFVTLMPGHSKIELRDFHLSKTKPLPHFHERGLRIVLQSARLGGVKENTPVYFRQVKIGSVINYNLKEDATGLNIEVFIKPCYAHLVRKNSYFYNASGIGMEVSLFGAKVKTETIESIISGGIGILTPDDYRDMAEDKDAFILNETFDQDALEWTPKLHASKRP
ncbi:MAG TPA: MCE family protein [Sulfurimonas sp.]|nr:MCE family protein [Sulfurimonas sp.]